MIPEQEKRGYGDLRRLSAYSSIAIPTLRDHIRRNGLPCFKVSGKILVRYSEFDRWVERFRVSKEMDLKKIVNEIMENLKSGKTDN